ncbi:hypothetical protein F5Y03DRAFT_338481 [Xylaria venustula]|nr:hypothetical protein F5Y03DRAFT_338481 [Xylaria venustula]
MRPFQRVPDTECSFRTTHEAVEASIGQPPCSCPDCQNGFYQKEEQYHPEFSYRFRLSDNEARCLCREYLEQAEASRARLSSRLASHADVVMSKWRKQSKEKREAVLRAAAPYMSDTPWMLPLYSYDPDRKLIDTRSSSRRYKLLLPWLNIEVLKKNPAVLYALLHYRTVYAPRYWAAFDSRQLTISWACGWLDVDFSPKCVIMHGAQYGELVSWEKAAAHRADILGFPRARLVLEAQASLLGTLCKIVDRLLENTNDSQAPRTEKWRDLTANAAFKFTDEVEFWSPYTNPAFSIPPPAILDIERLLSLAKTRLDATADHLWHLQCSTVSMRRFFKQVIENHVFRKIKPDPEAIATRVATEVFHDVFSHYRWRWLEIECRHVQGFHRRFRDSIHQGNPLPPQYDRALGGLEIFVVNQVIKRANALSLVYLFSPGLSHHYKVEQEPGMSNNQAHIKQIIPNNTQKALEDDPLAWILMQLLGMPDTQTHYDHAELFSLLHHHLAANPSFKEKGRVDERMYSMLSDLATCHEILVGIRLCRPQNRNRGIEDFLKENREGWKRSRSIEEDSRQELPLKDLGRAGMKLMPHFFQATAHGGVTRDSLLRSRKASQALEEFWTSMRKILRDELQRNRSFFSRNEIDSMMEVVSAHSTPEYLDAARTEEEALSKMSQVTHQPAPPTIFPSDAGESGAKSQLISQARRDKVKSRPQSDGAAIVPPDREPELAPETAADVRNQIRATRRVMDIINLLYPKTAAESSKSVNWEDFVYALRDMGFTARNNGGSAVLFEKSDGGDRGDGGGKIVFHRPHPVAKIDPVMLHSMGRRMTKWFGWTRELFVLDGDT